MTIRLPTSKLALWVAAGLVSCVSAKAILGVDLGSLYMKVALVQRGAPLEIVTNLHSKRKTEQMILFDNGSRFYGADASSLLARKPTKTPTTMSIMLGRDDEHPIVKVLEERHYPLIPAYNETRNGLCISVDGKDAFTPEELVAMVLNHAREITHAYGTEKGNVFGDIKDCVLTVPSFATQTERLALLDAATLADFNVLSLIDENTAAALHFGMDKKFEEPHHVLFYNLGASSLQVTLVKYHSYDIPESKNSKKTKSVGSIQVLGKTWDATMGGLAFDNRLVEYMADHFNKEWRSKRGHKKDIREVPRAMTKIRLQANKVKHVLSANNEIPIHMDSLHDDMSLAMHITRKQFEDLCSDLMVRAVAPVTNVLKVSNITLDEVDAIELIGGGMRVPKVQAGLAEALDGKELGMHINSDESMALGAAFYGANVSTAFRVRHVGLTDVNPFSLSISLQDLGTVQEEEKKGGLFGKKKKEDDEAWSKHATMFKANGKLGVKKTIAFSHDKDVSCAIDYEESDFLPEGTPTALQRYNITGVEKFASEMEEKGLGKPKISLQFELSASGITQLVKADVAVEETVMVDEEVEVDDDDEDNETTTEDEKAAEEKTEESAEEVDLNATDANATDSDATDSDAAPKKKKKKITVQKEKKKVHKRALTIATYYVGKTQPYSPELMEESLNKMEELARKDAERVKLEQAKNKLESYIYAIKNKLADDEDNIAKISTEEQREELRKLATDAEDWMYDDGYNADLETTEAKYTELSVPAEKVWFRLSEMTARPEAIEALQAKLAKVEGLMTKWTTTMPQVTEEERSEVLEKVEAVKDWVKEREAEQAEKKSHEDPAFSSAEVPLQTKTIERIVSKLSKKPKPKPPKEDKNATDNESKEGDSETEDASDSDASNATDSEASGEGETTEDTDEDKKEDEL